MTNFRIENPQLDKNFIQQMNRLSTCWKDLNSSQERLARIYSHVKDLPVGALKDIVNSMIDNSSKMPLPQDFLKAATEWRKNYYFKTGKYFGDQNKQEHVSKPDCNYCLDVGLTKVTAHDLSETSLMRCNCPIGVLNSEPLPMWSDEILSAYKRTSIESAWFNPAISDQNTETQVFSKIWAKVEELRKIKNKAILFWKNKGY